MVGVCADFGERYLDGIYHKETLAQARVAAATSKHR